MRVRRSRTITLLPLVPASSRMRLDLVGAFVPVASTTPTLRRIAIYDSVIFRSSGKLKTAGRCPRASLISVRSPDCLILRTS
jgi:hypothetical protein